MPTEFQDLLNSSMQAVIQEQNPQPTTPPVTEPQVPTQQQSAEPPSIAPTEETIGGIPKAAFAEAFKAYTNGKDLDILKEIEEVPKLRQSITEYEAKSKVSPFVNPVVEKLNELYAAKADAKTVSMFLEAQTLDIDNMPERERYAQALVRKYPSYSVEKARSLFDNKFGSDDLDEETELQKLEAIEQATTFLKSQKMAAENPEQIRMASEARERQERFKAQWQEQLRAVAPKVTGYEGKYKDGEQELSYKAVLTSQEVETVLPYVLNDMASQGMELNQNNVAVAQDLIFKYAVAANPIKYFEAIHRDAFAKGKEYQIKALAGDVQTKVETGGAAELSVEQKFIQANPFFAKL